MATDYDALRVADPDGPGQDSLDELKATRDESRSGVVDVEEVDTAESFELPGGGPVR